MPEIKKQGPAKIQKPEIWCPGGWSRTKASLVEGGFLPSWFLFFKKPNSYICRPSPGPSSFFFGSCEIKGIVG